MEVGKKYKYDPASNYIYTAEMLTPKGNMIVSLGENEFIISKSSFHLYIEYKELKTHTCFVVWYKSTKYPYHKDTVSVATTALKEDIERFKQSETMEILKIDESTYIEQ